MTSDGSGLTISGMAEATGLTVHTLRYYERTGIMLTPVTRATSTHRRYSETDVAWTVFLTRLRSTGMPIRTIRRYVDLVRAGESTALERLELLRAHREAVVRELEETRASLRAIEVKISRYAEAVDDRLRSTADETALDALVGSIERTPA